MGKKSRTKGAVGELEVCDLLEKLFLRKPQRELDQYQESLGRDIKNCRPLCVQVKRYKSITPGCLDKAFEEACSAVDDHYEFPVVFYREDRKKWRVHTSYEVLSEILDKPTSADDRTHSLFVDMNAADFVEWLHENW